MAQVLMRWPEQQELGGRWWLWLRGGDGPHGHQQWLQLGPEVGGVGSGMGWTYSGGDVDVNNDVAE
ncbi:hypothetical protein GN244_ATG02030 [Phytophthora infestans]|uniref:Uncharacterized protein n=1 Tax=Phytophthora infestans TaxID=4787 RepID=A0A833TRY8_PHYIN|nr:hypothetical protein GN244_ATG02030 [Phytophthora infestans]KAF4127348.1 hypothetical protein GN958_ATG23460 [Phytophthora infestans]KAF4141318.1 hypothetical protein GN958_ATG09489 [Phytophthora infestans]